MKHKTFDFDVDVELRKQALPIMLTRSVIIRPINAPISDAATMGMRVAHTTWQYPICKQAKRMDAFARSEGKEIAEKAFLEYVSGNHSIVRQVAPAFQKPPYGMYRRITQESPNIHWNTLGFTEKFVEHGQQGYHFRPYSFLEHVNVVLRYAKINSAVFVEHKLAGSHNWFKYWEVITEPVLVIDPIRLIQMIFQYHELSPKDRIEFHAAVARSAPPEPRCLEPEATFCQFLYSLLLYQQGLLIDADHYLLNQFLIRSMKYKIPFEAHTNWAHYIHFWTGKKIVGALE